MVFGKMFIFLIGEVICIGVNSRVCIIYLGVIDGVRWCGS